jgi:ankyrin repeat protein
MYKFLHVIALAGWLGHAAPALSGDIRDDIIQSIKLDDAADVRIQLARGAEANMSDADGNTLLMVAAREGSTASVQVLLEAGAKVYLVNAFGDTALLLATFAGHDAIALDLLSRGASLRPNRHGWTPLMYAAFNGHEKLVRAYLPASEVNAATNTGMTALMVASMNGHEGIVHLLLAAGADTRMRTKGGQSATDLALERGNTDIAELLEATGTAGRSKR